MSRPRPVALRVAPHLLLVAVGYTLFAYAGLPALLQSRLGVGLSGFGLLTSAPLAAFVVVQPLAGRLVARTTTTRVLLAGGVVHAILSVALDLLLAAYLPLLVGRFLWGAVAGLVLSVGATHIARLESGGTGTLSQGAFGAMVTVGGAAGFLFAPPVVTATGGAGLHALGTLLALPAIAVCWQYRNSVATAPRDGTAGRQDWLAVVTDPVVVLTATCYVAVIGSYITLSTFITAYFDDVGVVGPLNALVLLVAAGGRTAGGLAVWRSPVGNAGLIGGGAGLAALGFAGLALATDVVVLVALPFLVMFAVSAPFGAVYDAAADATVSEGGAIAAVVAVGNFAALVLPPVTGALRESVGSYGAPFALLAGLNLVAAGSAFALVRTTGTGKDDG